MMQAESAPSQPPREAIGFNPFERFWLFMSKTDLYPAWYIATPETVATQKAIGLLVLSTGIFAFMSMFFALTDTLLNDKHWSIAVMCAAFYSIAIMTMDREMISIRKTHTDIEALPEQATWLDHLNYFRKWAWSKIPGAFLARVAFASIIGVVLSFPMELKIFERAINEQITRDIDKVTAEVKEERKRRQLDVDAKRQDAIASAKRALAEQEKLVAQANDEYNRERMRGRCEERCQKDLEILEHAQKKQEELQKKVNGADAVAMEGASSDLEKIQAIDKEVKRKEKEAQTDFLQRARALENIVTGKNLPEGLEKSESAYWITIGLKVFFIAFELFPMIVKFFMVQNEYHAYLEGRLLIARQRMICYTNAKLDEVSRNRTPSASDISEISDYIALFSEDPYEKTRPPGIIQSLLRKSPAHG